MKLVERSFQQFIDVRDILLNQALATPFKVEGKYLQLPLKEMVTNTFESHMHSDALEGHQSHIL